MRIVLIVLAAASVLLFRSLFTFYAVAVVNVDFPLISSVPQHSDLLRTLKNSRTSTTNESVRLVACAIIKNMTNAAQVWVAFHLLQGFHHFMFYDDGSVPPLQASDFGKLSDFVTVRSTTDAKNAHKPPGEGRKLGSELVVRQWKSYWHYARELLGTNTQLVFFDVDEFFWSCDLLTPFSDIVRSHGKTQTLLTGCPRFASAQHYDPSIPIFYQLTRRAPVYQLQEPEHEIKSKNHDCNLTSINEPTKGVCFGSSMPKLVVNMSILSSEMVMHITQHGMYEWANQPKVNFTTAYGTINRENGLCCNHYFVRDIAEAERKSKSNGNDFYSRYAAHKGVRNFYDWKVDTTLPDSYGESTLALLKEAGLDFHAPNKFLNDTLQEPSLSTTSSLISPQSVSTNNKTLDGAVYQKHKIIPTLREVALRAVPRIEATAIIKNMLEEAQVWVAFHLLQGFHHFTFYDDSSADDTPLHSSDFKGLADFVTVIPWHSAASDPESGFQKMGRRQYLSVRDFASKRIGNHTYVASFDVDEFMYPCDPSQSILSLLQSYNVTSTILGACPRYSPVDQVQPGVPVFDQLLLRAPTTRLKEPEWQHMLANPDCSLRKSLAEPQGVCFGATQPKNIYDLRTVNSDVIYHIQVHGIMQYPESPINFSSYTATRSRDSDICCNHYFAKDLADCAQKSGKNGNDLYAHVLNSSIIRQFYRWKFDNTISKRFSEKTISLLLEAGLPFSGIQEATTQKNPNV